MDADRRFRRSTEALHPVDRGPQRRYFRALLARFGPFDEVTYDYATTLTELWWVFRRASEQAGGVDRKLRHGRGQRPTVEDLERRWRRQGKSFGSFDQALKRLEELAVGQRRRPASIAELTAALTAARRASG